MSVRGVWVAAQRLYDNVRTLSVSRVHAVVLIAGSMVVSAWTLIKFFDYTFIFDLVGQWGMAQQWLLADPGGSVVGPTNYVIKILLLYIPAALLPTSPLVDLIIVTLIVNVVTFVLLVLVLERLWRELTGDKPGRTFYLAALWLAILAGSVYWIQFTNSRNLEVAGGLVAVLFGIRLAKRMSYRWLAAFTAFLGLLFFADPLQLYMSLVPLLVFLVVYRLWFARIIRWRSIVLVAAAVIVGFVLSKLLFAAAKSLLGVSVFGVASGIDLGVLKQGLLALPAQITRLLFGGIELGRLLGMLNLALMAGLVGLAAYNLAVVRSKRHWPLIAAAVITFGVNCAVYVLTGAVMTDGSFRYLIMIAPWVVVVMAYALSMRTRIRLVVLTVVLTVAVANLAVMGSAMVRVSGRAFDGNRHINSAAQYMLASNHSFGYASMDTSMPADYLTSQRAGLIPINCTTGGTLTRTQLFFNTTFADHLMRGADPSTEVPVLLDDDGIRAPLCTRAGIIAQLGMPLRIESLADGDTVLIYQLQQLRSTGL